MGASLLVLVRHAESLRNTRRRLRGFFADEAERAPVAGISDRNIPLTELGRAQAGLVARALYARFGAFDRVVHSGYRRTADTADAIVSVYSRDERAAIQLEVDERVRERESGYGFEMTVAEAESAFPWLQPYWATHGPFFARPPGGESVADVAFRARSFVAELDARDHDERIVVVSHGVAIAALRYVLERWSYDRVEQSLRSGSVSNTSVTVFERDERGAWALRDEDASHLASNT